MKTLSIFLLCIFCSDLLLIGHGCSNVPPKSENKIIESEPIGRNQFEIKLRKKKINE